MSDSLNVTIDTIKKLTYLTKDQQQELYEELVSDIPLSETFLVHGEISADQYMKNLTSQEQQQISTELGSDDLSERIQQSVTRILSVQSSSQRTARAFIRAALTGRSERGILTSVRARW